jgi:hypothetical protein
VVTPVTVVIARIVARGVIRTTRTVVPTLVIARVMARGVIRPTRTVVPNVVIARIVARGVIRTTRTVVPNVVITCLAIDVPGVVLMGSRVVGPMLRLGHAGAERHNRKR